MIKTFAELQQTAEVDPQDVIDTLRDYAESGASIKGTVVTQILDRAQFSGEQMRELLDSAQTGASRHVHMSDNTGFPHVAPEVNARAMREGAWMSVLNYAIDGQVEKQDAEMREAGEYQTVANYVERILRKAEQQ